MTKATTATQQFLADMGRKIREARVEKGLRLQDVDERTYAGGQRVDFTTLSRYERGQRAITAPRLRAVAEALEVGVETLLPIRQG